MALGFLLPARRAAAGPHATGAAPQAAGLCRGAGHKEAEDGAELLAAGAEDAFSCSHEHGVPLAHHVHQVRVARRQVLPHGRRDGVQAGHKDGGRRAAPAPRLFLLHLPRRPRKQRAAHQPLSRAQHHVAATLRPVAGVAAAQGAGGRPQSPQRAAAWRTPAPHTAAARHRAAGRRPAVHRVHHTRVVWLVCYEQKARRCVVLASRCTMPRQQRGPLSRARASASHSRAAAGETRTRAGGGTAAMGVVRPRPAATQGRTRTARGAVPPPLSRVSPLSGRLARLHAMLAMRRRRDTTRWPARPWRADGGVTNPRGALLR